MQKSQNAFTLIELMVVVVVLAIIAGYGIPNYNKSQARVNERDGEYNLGTIASAMEMYRMRNDGVYPLGSALDNIGEINTTLYLGIIGQNIVYSCTSDGTIFTCTANPDDYAWELDVSDTNNGNPRCSTFPADPCPTCLAGGC